MTALTKPVRRTTSAVVFDRGTRPVIVSLEPPNVLGFRTKGTHKTYRLPIETCYRLAVRAYAEDLRRQKAAARKAKQRLAQS